MSLLFPSPPPVIDDQKNASYWLGKNRIKKGKADAFQLAAYRRSIANFVRILTNKQIPVTFKVEGKASFTDGKEVVLSSDISDEKFDSVVGLALHEAAHILKSDFAALKTLEKDIDDELYDLGQSKGLNKQLVQLYLHKMWNWIEDRYIDAWVYNSAPGYRGYYDSLYARYWHNDEISETLKSELFRRPKLKSYSFRIINLTNENSDYTALPGLEEIVKIADLDNILRLTKYTQRMAVAEQITTIVFNNIDELKKIKKKKKSKEKSDEPGEGASGNNPGSNDGPMPDPDEIVEFDEPPPPTSKDDSKEEEKSKPLNEGGDEEDENPPPQPKEDSKNDETIGKEEDKKAEEESDEVDEDKEKELDEKEKELDKIIDEQSKFLNGEVDKTAVPQKINEKLDLLEKGSTNLVPVGEGIVPNVTCIVMKSISKEVILSSIFPFKTSAGSVEFNNNKESISKGIILGISLGHKLKVRGETNSLKYVRQRNGKIERSLIHELGFSNASVFSRTYTEQYKKVELHLSVDISSSMRGPKWYKTLTCITAVAKAATMIDNINVVISFRGTDDGCKHPFIFIAYDSKVDKFAKLQALFPYIIPDGGTPEGLAFQAITDLIPATNMNVDSYFVNFSDGEPCFGSATVGINGLSFHHSYQGRVAHDHTRKQMNLFLQKNIKILSYFISDSGTLDYSKMILSHLKTLNPSVASQYDVTDDEEAFRRMYGKAANFIDVTNIVEVAKTLNRKFLEK